MIANQFGMGKEPLPPVELKPAGFTPDYGWPIVSKTRRNRRGLDRSPASRRTNLIVGACLVVALGLVIYFTVEVIVRI